MNKMNQEIEDITKAT
jgi:predicted  nucleic acid-binding Zn-ribbon protein